MRLLLYVEPLIMHNRPLHYWAWLDRAAAIGHALRATGGGHEIRLVTNEALAGRAVAPPGPGNEVNRRKHEGLPPEWVVPLSQSLLRRHFDAPNVAILEGLHHGRWPAERVQACGQDLRAALSGFEPDVILTFTPSDHLASAFPGALVLHSEFGFFSRHPFPVTHYFDPLGLYARSTLGVHAEALLARRPDAREHAWLDGLREELRAWLLAASPFGGLEMELRRRFRRVVLLPLQFGGEAGFDVNGPFRNQAEYLFHVLERLPDSVGLIVTEHPSARLLGDSFDDETREHLRSRWPQAVFVDPSVVLHGSQMLLLHADAVICLSSSLGLQALFWRKPLVSPGWSHLAPYASVHSLADLDPGRDLDPIADRDGVVGWMVRHYFIPEPLCLNDPEWLERFLRVSLDRHAAGRLGLDFYDPIAGDDAIRGFYRAPAPAALRSTVRADILRNGRFEQWRRRSAKEETPLHWELLAPAGSRVIRGEAGADSAGPGPRGKEGEVLPYVRIEGPRSGGAGSSPPTLLLQRISKLDRLSGMFVSLEFVARGPRGGTLSVYLYQQFDAPGAPVQGTAAKSYELTPEWRRLCYTALVPVAPESPRGPAHHTEVVFRLEGGSGGTAGSGGAGASGPVAEIADVTLGPGSISTRA